MEIITNGIKLKVAEAMPDDVNKGVVRIDSSFLRDLDIRPGNIIEIVGERVTVAIADRSLPGDMGLNIIRMDGLIRRNAKTTIGELVEIKKADVKEAKKVVVAPARAGVIIKASPEIFKQGLLGRAVVKGDIVSLGGTRRRKNMMAGSPFYNDVFSMLGDTMSSFGLGDLKLIVVDAQPKQAVLITEHTHVNYNPEEVEVEEDKIIDITYEDVGGLHDEIKKVREMVELPLKHPEVFQRLGIDAPKGVLLHGPPGTGKTLLAKAVANETNANFLLINGPEIMGKYYGQSEENLRKKFEEAEKNAPSIIFIDEIDAIAPKREESKGEVERRVVAQLLALMDGLKSRGKVVVIAATNIPNALDPALRRPGRFDREMEIGVPQKEGRLDIMKIHTRNMPLYNWDNESAGKTLLSVFKEKQSEKKQEFDQSQEKITILEKELHDLESQKKDSSKLMPDILKEIINKINVKQDKKKKLEDKIRELKLLVDDLKKDYELLSKDKSKLGLLISKLEQIEHKEELFGDDARSDLLRESKKKKEKEVDDLIIRYKQLGIINQDFYDRALKNSVQKMLKRIAEVTHGFVGADLAALAKEAAMIVLRRILPNLNLDKDDNIPQEVLDKLQLLEKDFKDALKVVRPSAMREVLIETPNIKWSDIGGLGDVKQELVEAVEWPLNKADSFIRLGIKPPKGVLLYGAPGTGKTLLAKAVANESEANFILVKGPELLSKWVGESEKAVRKIFEKARQTAPTIIFFDEIDAMAHKRSGSSENPVNERVVNQLLTEMDGLQDLNDVVIIAATNRPDILDTALLRPGRFDRIVMVPVPDEKVREAVLKVHTKNIPLSNDVDLKILVKKTENYVGADIEAVCREAAIMALREDLRTKDIKMKFFEQALEKVRPSVTKEIDEAYKSLKDQFSSARAKSMQEEKPSYYG